MLSEWIMISANVESNTLHQLIWTRITCPAAVEAAAVAAAVAAPDADVRQASSS